MVSVDFFVVPTISFRLLFAFLVLAHDRRRVLHFNVTAHPTAEWTADQILQAFPWDTAPGYLLRDRDSVCGDMFRRQVSSMGIREVLTAPRSSWQSRYVERLIGSIRRECLGHIVAISEESLRTALRSYFSYYHDSRCHLGLPSQPPPIAAAAPENAGGLEICLARVSPSTSSMTRKRFSSACSRLWMVAMLV